MKLSKKGLQCLVVIFAVGIIAVAAVAGDKGSKNEPQSEKTLTAGVVNSISVDKDKAPAQVEGLELELSTSGKEESESKKETDEEADSEEQQGENRLIVTVKDSLNVRAKATANSKVVGKMLPQCGAKVLEEKENWVKIKSGNVKGYIKKKYCVIGKDAMEYAKKHGCYKAESKINGLRVRYKASTDSKIYSVVDKGSKLKLAKKECKVEGWVAVNYNGKRAYLSEEYVKVGCTLEAGLTMKEYNAKLAAEAKKKEEAKKAAKPSTTKQDSVAADVDDVTLLAALIDCEAGAQTYEGKLAVGAVVCNRIRSSRYPNTLRGVIYQRGQFGPAHSGALARKLNGTIDSGCRRAAVEALGGADNVGGALHFRSRHSGIDGLVICGHVFY